MYCIVVMPSRYLGNCLVSGLLRDLPILLVLRVFFMAYPLEDVLRIDVSLFFVDIPLCVSLEIGY